MAFRSPALFRVVRCGHHRLWHLRYREKKSYCCTWEKSPAPHSSSLLPELTSTAHPIPKAARTVPEKPKGKCLTKLPYNTLLLDSHPAHNRLTFSNRSPACSFAPLRLHAAPEKKKKKRRKMHMLRYCLKPQPAHSNSCHPLLYLGRSPARPPSLWAATLRLRYHL